MILRFKTFGAGGELHAIALNTQKETYSLNVASVLNVKWDVAEIPPRTFGYILSEVGFNCYSEVYDVLEDPEEVPGF